MEKTILFQESTRPPKGIMLLFILPYFFLVYGTARQLIYGIPLGNKPVSDLHLTTFTICCGITIFLISRIRAELKVTKEGFYISTIPLIPGDLNKWNRVKDIRVENYSLIKEHLGIGFRGINTQMAYLAGSQPGIKLHFQNDDKIILAARDQQRLLEILAEISVINTKVTSNHISDI